MFRFLQLLVCFFACAGAFEVSMSRRAILSRVAAAAPLAAAGAAFADADNRFLTTVARPDIAVVSGADKVKVSTVGTPILTDDNGSAIKPNAVLSTKEASNYAPATRGVKLPKEVKAKAMDRLMAK